MYEVVEHNSRLIAALTLLVALMISLIFVGLWVWAAEFSANKGFGLLQICSFPAWLETCFSILIFDFAMYWWHRFSHKVPFLWRFHRVHHSDKQMDVSTAFRFHAGELFLSSFVRVGLILALGCPLWHVALYEGLMFPVVQFHHSNIALSARWERILGLFIVTPQIHKIHHSRDWPETDSNFTSFLSIWDKIFKSSRSRPDPDNIEFGLKEFDCDSYQTLKGLLKTPLD